MANEFVARKGIISLGDLTVDTLSGNNGEIVTLDAAGKMVASGVTTANIVSGLVSGSAQIDHDSTTGFVANEHIDHSTVSVTAGNGLTGGGTIAATRTINVVSGNNGIVVNADDITLATSSTTFTGGVKSKMNADAVVSGSATQVRAFLNVADGANNYTHPNHTGDVTSTGDGATVLAAAAITGKTALTTGLASTDELLVSDNGTLKRMDTSVLQTYMQSNLTFTTNTDVDVSVANLTTRLGQIPGNATIGGGSSTITIPGDLVVTGTTTTNNVETVSTSNGVIFEGNAADANELTLLAGTLTADQTVTLPDATGTLALDNGSYPNLRAQATTKADVGLGNVENTALSTWAGSSNITTLGTIATGVWQGSEISTTYIADLSGTNTGDEPDASATVKGIIEIATNAEVTAGTDTVRAITPSSLTSITKLGTIGTGTWQGTSISTTYTDAKVTSVVAGAGIDVSSTTGAVTVSAEDASATNPGVIEIATNAEVTTGTDTVRAITPSSLTSITKLGTIGTGTWQGTKIASAYLDDDTAHLSTTQTFTGTKTFTSKVVLDTDSGDNVDLFTDYTATVAGAGATTTIASYTSAAAVAVYFDYRISDATTNLRAGTVMAISNGSTVAYTEYSTGDIGDTSAVTLSVDYSGGAIRLRALNDAGSYRANVFVRTV